MKAFTYLLFLGAAISSVVAAPADEGKAPAAPRKFFLVTRSSDARFTGKCVYGYHTGAALSDATLGDCGPAPSKDFSYDGKRLTYYGFGKNIIGGVQFNEIPATYNDWYPVTLDTAQGTRGLVYDKSKGGFKQKTSGLQQRGFIVCNWSHANAPQLFGLTSSYVGKALPSNCGKVELYRGCFNTDKYCKDNTF